VISDEIPEIFLNKQVKLVKQDGFCLYGRIVSVNKKNLFFETPSGSSVIDLKYIKEIVVKQREERNELRKTCKFGLSCTKRYCTTDGTVCGDYERK